jgi:hypothetical protein
MDEPTEHGLRYELKQVKRKNRWSSPYTYRLHGEWFERIFLDIGILLLHHHLKINYFTLMKIDFKPRKWLKAHNNSFKFLAFDGS